jgi:methylmalonyl-CoA mutase
MSTKSTWIEAAKAELKQADPFETLKKKWGDWPIKPYYDATDRVVQNVVQKVLIPHKYANGWLNLPLVSTQLEEFNLLAINHLNKGADGIVVRLNTSVKAEQVLSNIKPEFCFLGFEAPGDSFSFFEPVELLLQPAEKMHGCIFWNDAPHWLKVARLFKAHTKFRCFGIHVRTLDSITLERALREAISMLDELTDNTFTAPHVFPKFAFSVTGSSNFFLDVAMIRSLKVLFERLALAYGVSGVPAFVRYVVPASAMSAYDPHGAMISGSLSALSAVSASVDAVTVEAENQNSVMHAHTARSVSLLLKEESKLDKVVDPLAGAYFIENLTNTIVEKIWANLKNV